MSELTLTRDQRLALRARAHHLNPVVLLGAAGLTEAVLKETDRALTAHELIKVRIPGDDREQRGAIGAQIAERLGAAIVETIGKLLVLYRPRPPETETGPPPRRSSAGTSRGRQQPAAAGRAAAVNTAARRGNEPRDLAQGSRAVARPSARSVRSARRPR